MSAALRFNAMHFMPYVHLPEHHKEFKSTWVSFPNKYYTPSAATTSMDAICRNWCWPTGSVTTPSW